MFPIVDFEQITVFWVWTPTLEVVFDCYFLLVVFVNFKQDLLKKGILLFIFTESISYDFIDKLAFNWCPLYHDFYANCMAVFIT